MSTKATIAHMSGAWHLYEEMNLEEVYVDIVMDQADFLACKHDIRIKLPEGVIDAIRSAKPSSIPHLRKKGTP